MDKLSDKARQLKNAYLRAWRIKNPNRVLRLIINYWEKRAKEVSQVIQVESQM